ncbi:hypothetical protein RBY4I_474 [Rhodobacterales bacterium Y4I]|nr:hypothetical protein RBY4I_474 [Rhodobacterales bacterium Y4I]
MLFCNKGSPSLRPNATDVKQFPCHGHVGVRVLQQILPRAQGMRICGFTNRRVSRWRN